MVASDEEYIRVQVKKDDAEATKMICGAPDEDAAIRTIYKNWYERFREGDSNLKGRERISKIISKISGRGTIQLLYENSTNKLAALQVARLLYFYQ